MTTLAARLSSPLPAALSIIGVLGPQARALSARLFHGVNLLHAQRRRPYYGTFGIEVRDDVVVTIERRQDGDEVIITGHGGWAISEALLADLQLVGVRVVESTEYLRQLGLTEIQCEARAALTQCSSSAASMILLDQYNGALDAAFAQVMASPRRLDIKTLLHWSKLGRRLASGFRVVLYGQSNAGKSSLLNALAGFDRAIVQPTPGTTRDVLSVGITLAGWTIELWDGAGFRDDAGELERIGQDRLRQRWSQADLGVFVLDLSRGVQPIDQHLLAAMPADLIVGSKSDLPTQSITRLSIDVRTSAATRAGIDDLAAALSQRLVPKLPIPGQPVPFTDRQVEVLRRFLTNANEVDND